MSNESYLAVVHRLDLNCMEMDEDDDTKKSKYSSLAIPFVHPQTESEFSYTLCKYVIPLHHRHLGRADPCVNNKLIMIGDKD